MRQREEGICLAYSKADGPIYVLPISEYPRILKEWMAGQAFWSGQGFYGSDLNIKLGDIVAISMNTPEILAFSRIDQVEDEKEDQIR